MNPEDDAVPPPIHRRVILEDSPSNPAPLPISRHQSEDGDYQNPSLSPPISRRSPLRLSRSDQHPNLTTAGTSPIRPEIRPQALASLAEAHRPIRTLHHACAIRVP